MGTLLLPAIEDLRDAVTDEVTQLGGQVTDVHHHGSLLLMRSILPHADDVRPDDQVRGGVAVRTRGPNLLVLPYVFRQVCRNGAVMAQAVDSFRVRRVDFSASHEQVNATLQQLRDAVRTCGRVRAFDRQVHAMRRAAEIPADTNLLLAWMHLLRSHRLGGRLLRQIERNYAEGEDFTAFGWMNALTAVARETPDPETRWRLEELGGGVPALVAPVARPGGAAARPVLV